MEEAKDAAPPVWQLREEYVESIAKAEKAEREAYLESGEIPSDQPETGWWL